MRRAILDLPPEQREVILLHHSEDLSQREIAERLGVHQATVSRHLARALRALRGTLEPVLRRQALALRPSPRAMKRMSSLIASVAALSKTAQAVLAASGPMAGWTGSGGTAPQGAATGTGIAGLWELLNASLIAGGRIMAAIGERRTGSAARRIHPDRASGGRDRDLGGHRPAQLSGSPVEGEDRAGAKRFPGGGGRLGGIRRGLQSVSADSALVVPDCDPGDARLVDHHAGGIPDVCPETGPARRLELDGKQPRGAFSVFQLHAEPQDWIRITGYPPHRAWCLVCWGPDMVPGEGEHLEYPPAWNTAIGALPIIFDPTNGIASEGDPVRFGGATQSPCAGRV
ncbi:MAG: sigma-70 family RNA polymerase sigma factor [Candidatus Sumerlaeia bacterium]|nr:sigma-70 family RNA polymerase sigma factor [Candidatus Sumerlaeia bacterium]